MRQLLPFAISLTLIGCATTKTDVRNDAEMSKYDPATTARVRLITGDTTYGGYVSGQSCEAVFSEAAQEIPAEQRGWVKAHIDSEGLYPFRASDRQNSVIGMPATQATKAINDSPKIYDEHVVPANQPLIAAFSMGGSQISCWPKPVTFTPEPGQDYEMQYEMVKFSTFKAGCVIKVRKLSSLANTTVETPMSPQICVKTAAGIYQPMDPQ